MYSSVNLIDYLVPPSWSIRHQRFYNVFEKRSRCDSSRSSQSASSHFEINLSFLCGESDHVGVVVVTYRMLVVISHHRRVDWLCCYFLIKVQQAREDRFAASQARQSEENWVWGHAINYHDNSRRSNHRKSTLDRRSASLFDGSGETYRLQSLDSRRSTRRLVQSNQLQYRVGQGGLEWRAALV